MGEVPGVLRARGDLPDELAGCRERVSGFRKERPEQLERVGRNGVELQPDLNPLRPRAGRERGDLPESRAPLIKRRSAAREDDDAFPRATARNDRPEPILRRYRLPLLLLVIRAVERAVPCADPLANP